MLTLILGLVGKLFSALQNLVLAVLQIQKKKQDGFMDTPGSHIIYREITKNITLFTNETYFNINNFRLEPQREKPIVILGCWLMADRKHSTKFAKFWIEKGFDVLAVNVHVLQFLWPITGTQIVAADVVKFLEKNKCYSQIILHGFSISGYQWGEALVHMSKNQDRYQHILDKIVGQVWDSIGSFDDIPCGLPIALFPKNKVLAAALHKYLLFHLNVFENFATKHYRRSNELFHTNLVQAPALLILSKADPIGNVPSNTRLRESWESRGIKVHWKLFEKSRHVDHYRKHPEEYIAQINMFLDSLNLPQFNEMPNNEIENTVG